MKKDALIQSLQGCGALQHGHFVLTSGAISDYYIDIKKASTNPMVLKTIAQYMKPFTKGYDLIAGMEIGAVPLAVALSLETQIPYVIIRKEKREHGTGKQIEGPQVQHKRVLLLEDVTTSGGSLIKSIQILKRNHAILQDVIVVVDRESGAKELILSHGLEFHPLLTVADILP